MMVARDAVFYQSQRSRGDITAVPEVLCQPGMAGEPVVVRYDESDSDNSSLDTSESGQRTESPVNLDDLRFHPSDHEDLAAERGVLRRPPYSETSDPTSTNQLRQFWLTSNSSNGKQLSSARLDELLNIPTIEHKKVKWQEDAMESIHHRRSQSLPASHQVNEKSKLIGPDRPKRSAMSPKTARSNTKGNLVRVSSFGNLEEHQPELLDQARLRAASSDTKHHRFPSSSGGSSSKKNHRRIPTASPRSNRDNSKQARYPKSVDFVLVDAPMMSIEPAALSLDDIEQSFDQVLHRGSQAPRPNFAL
jgi:hypothetical protein